jgi:nucleotide-binding universal stress UspA family protein
MNRIPTTKRIVVAYDFSELADRVLAHALDLAASSDEVHVLCVGTAQGDLLKLPEHPAVTHAQASETLRAAIADDVAEYVAAHGPVRIDRLAVYASDGHPAEQIVALADEVDADLIVLGTHGRTGLERVMLGSVAEAVTRRANCGVYVIRPRDFLKGQKLPEIQRAPLEGEPTLRHFRPRALYHYTSRMQQEADRVFPVA